MLKEVWIEIFSRDSTSKSYNCLTTFLLATEKIPNFHIPYSCGSALGVGWAADMLFRSYPESNPIVSSASPSSAPEVGLRGGAVGALGNTVTFGSLAFDRDANRPFSPRLGGPIVASTASPVQAVDAGVNLQGPRPQLPGPQPGIVANGDVLPKPMDARPSHHERFMAAPGGVWVPTGPRALNGLNHQTDPLPWARDGATPRCEAAASAQYNLDVLRPERPHSSSGEDEVMRDLLVDSDDENTPVHLGPSAARLSADRRQRAEQPLADLLATPTPSSNRTTNIRKVSPVNLRGDEDDGARTRRRTSGLAAQPPPVLSNRVRKPPRGPTRSQPEESPSASRPVESKAAHPAQVAANVPKVTPTIQYCPFAVVDRADDAVGSRSIPTTPVCSSGGGHATGSKFGTFDLFCYP
ncbi:uncharacterized protein MELLADRAFT_108800 [Melampsora larici-populina 98AG31]|uniref:Uncharacterized protein n=1 Tax=Melampsora larici-populina (strain 98AG31 / pathotype 3-4-7) TaxID=747676 RepID=F4RUA5_MELLP|nr:uncharacterized protein MELLADRAFT_108800 [Melampsora larici-populina 98AG31]EGG03901.1 hypothetical protein MELLADRAFT_108800 [Melampsora larici-populina 98AG31]